MPELKVDTAELRAQMGRANITQLRLAELAKVHRNTITLVLKNATGDLETIAAITNGLNIALRAAGQPEIAPFDLLKSTGFPSPQLAAPAAMRELAYS
jgi:transcriptional regulator with XRE-family HTH domain